RLGAAWLLAGVVIVALAARAFVATPRGQALVLGRVEREVRRRTGLVVHARSLRGSLLFGAHLEGVRVADPRGFALMSAPSVELSWDPLSLLARRPRVAIEIVSPEIAPRLPRVELARLPKLSGASLD